MNRQQLIRPLCYIVATVGPQFLMGVKDGPMTAHEWLRLIGQAIIAAATVIVALYDQKAEPPASLIAQLTGKPESKP